jgi:L-asparaginase
MSKPRVAVASLGGTITMTTDDRDDATVVPTLDADDLVASVPELADAASLTAHTLSTIPGASLTPPDLLRALTWARKQVDGGADGVVLAQGTDTIEETAYLLDLHWEHSAPLVVTGAMRNPSLAGSDGPANLLAAVRAAASPRARDLGALVIMNDQIHAAARVRKVRAGGTDAFASPDFGPLGFLEEGAVVIGNRPRRWPGIAAHPERSVPRIALLETYLGDDGATLDLVADAGYDGIVLAGFGVGHASPKIADALERAVARCPVVLASRTGSGTTYRATYGFIGSESDLLARGAIASGWLDPRKSRILLSSLISAGFDREAIRVEFARRGCNPGGPAEQALPTR